MGESEPILHVQRIGGSRRRQVELGAMPLTVGRSSENVLVLRHADVSRRHCVVEPCPQGFQLKDLGSRFGTLVNGERVDACLLHDHDRIRIGPYELIVSLNGSSGLVDPAQPTPRHEPDEAAADTSSTAHDLGQQHPTGPLSAAPAAELVTPLKEALDKALKRIEQLERQQTNLRRALAERARESREPAASDLTAPPVSTGWSGSPPGAPPSTVSLGSPLVDAVVTVNPGDSRPLENAPGSRPGLARPRTRGDSWADRDYLAWVVVGICAVALVAVLILAIVHLTTR